MNTSRKITVQIPEELLKKAQSETGKGITETVRRGLKLIAASNSYKELIRAKGKVKFSKSLDELKHDRI